MIQTIHSHDRTAEKARAGVTSPGWVTTKLTALVNYPPKKVSCLTAFPLLCRPGTYAQSKSNRRDDKTIAMIL
jgi:hypothetical protein